MKHQIVLDTETTGLEVKKKHRIIEIGCIRLDTRHDNTSYRQWYINPERQVDPGAYDIHGLSDEFLGKQPAFCEIAKDFTDFIADSELIIHNAPFDVGFINAELKRLGPTWGMLEDYCQITDTLEIARQKHPGQKNSLDALCERYGIDNSRRQKHGALLDAEILAEVYLLLTSKQGVLFSEEEQSTENMQTLPTVKIDLHGQELSIIEPTKQELVAHQAILDKIEKESDGKCIWLED